MIRKMTVFMKRFYDTVLNKDRAQTKNIKEEAGTFC